MIAKFILYQDITQADFLWCSSLNIIVTVDRETKDITVAGVRYKVAGPHKVLLTTTDEQAELLLKLRFGDKLVLLDKYHCQI